MDGMVGKYGSILRSELPSVRLSYDTSINVAPEMSLHLPHFCFRNGLPEDGIYLRTYRDIDVYTYIQTGIATVSGSRRYVAAVPVGCLRTARPAWPGYGCPADHSAGRSH
eukprot:1177916-Prorocentrum_minimum.AAC.2